MSHIAICSGIKKVINVYFYYNDIPFKIAMCYNNQLKIPEVPLLGEPCQPGIRHLAFLNVGIIYLMEWVLAQMEI
jgi:hypothetical protein